ncbi:MAG TPA: hypothetical protein VGU68_18500, partial [Ktedonobacteraceae bacterium]|nr:hypothetical protein [Ktedonobacteraceae bacterium]
MHQIISVINFTISRQLLVLYKASEHNAPKGRMSHIRGQKRGVHQFIKRYSLPGGDKKLSTFLHKR